MGPGAAVRLRSRVPAGPAQRVRRRQGAQRRGHPQRTSRSSSACRPSGRWGSTRSALSFEAVALGPGLPIPPDAMGSGGRRWGARAPVIGARAPRAARSCRHHDASPPAAAYRLGESSRSPTPMRRGDGGTVRAGLRPQIIDTRSGVDVDVMPWCSRRGRRGYRHRSGTGDQQPPVPGWRPHGRRRIEVSPRTPSSSGSWPPPPTPSPSSSLTYKGKTMAEIASPSSTRSTRRAASTGARIVPAHSGFNLASADSMLAACVNQAEDKRRSRLSALRSASTARARSAWPISRPRRSARRTRPRHALLRAGAGLGPPDVDEQGPRLRNWIDWMVRLPHCHS